MGWKQEVTRLHMPGFRWDAYLEWIQRLKNTKDMSALKSLLLRPPVCYDPVPEVKTSAEVGSEIFLKRNTDGSFPLVESPDEPLDVPSEGERRGAPKLINTIIENSSSRLPTDRELLINRSSNEEENPHKRKTKTVKTRGS